MVSKEGLKIHEQIWFILDAISQLIVLIYRILVGTVEYCILYHECFQNGFEDDFKGLFENSRDLCGSGAFIAVINDFWEDNKSQIKKNIYNEMRIAFIDFSDIRGNEQYMVDIGATAYSSDGIEHF